MIRRWLGKSLLVLSVVAAPAVAQEMTTDAERSWRELRNSRDVKRKLMAERWYNVVRQQDWGDATGKFKTSAKYVAHDPQLAWVKLRVIQGAGNKRVVKDVQIPLEKLNTACQARVRQIATLSEKIATAIEEEKKAEEEDEEGGAGEGREMAADPRAADPRSEGAERDAGLAGMDAEEVTAEAEGRGPPMGRGAPTASQPPPVTNDGPPLPALIPKLPPSQSASPAETPAERPDPRSAEPPADESAASDPTAFNHPTTPEELQAVFTEAFNSGDRETMEKLIFWDDTPEELRQETYSSLIHPAGTIELLSITIENRTADAAFIDHTLDSTTCFQVEYKSRTGEVAMSWPFAEVDGKFYLGAWNPNQAAVGRR